MRRRNRKHSRNRTIGEMLGSGDDWRRFRDEKTVEGVVACGAINQLMSESGLDLPLLGTIDAILCERAAAPVAMGEFFGEFRYR